MDEQGAFSSHVDYILSQASQDGPPQPPGGAETECGSPAECCSPVERPPWGGLLAHPPPVGGYSGWFQVVQVVLSSPDLSRCSESWQKIADLVFDLKIY